MDDLMSERNGSTVRWQELIGELSTLFGSTVESNRILQRGQDDLFALKLRNAELERRVKDLEREVQVWRDAHERESTTREAVAATKDRLARELTNLKEDAPLVVALLDGDGLIFSQDRINGGQTGGRNAALALHTAMRESAALEGVGKNATLFATVYCNRKGLRTALTRAGACTEAQFDSFWLGFSQAVALFTLVDVGPGKEAADAKIREALRMYATMPQVVRLFFGGAHDGGYRAPLSALFMEKCADKVSLICPSDEIAYDLRSLRLSEVRWKGLFMRNGNLGDGNHTPRSNLNSNIPLPGAGGTSGGISLGLPVPTPTPAKVEINTNPRHKDERKDGARSQDVTQSKFNKAVSIVQGLPKDGPIQPSANEQLIFYRYHKQATNGNVKGDRPGGHDTAGMARWDAWNSVRGTPKEAAWAKYVELLKVILKRSSNDTARKYTRQLDGA